MTASFGGVSDQQDAHGSQGASSSSSHAQEQQAHSAEINDVNVFWPDGILAQTSHRHAVFIAGHAFRGGPNEVNIIVTDLLASPESEQHQGYGNAVQCSSKGDALRLSLLGTLTPSDARTESVSSAQCRSKGKGRAVDSNDNRKRLVWMMVSACRNQRLIRIHKIHFQDAVLVESPTITVVYYDSHVPSSHRFFSLEAVRSSTRTPKVDADEQRLGGIYECQIASKPNRWFEVTGGMAAAHAPGSGLRKTIELLNSLDGQGATSRSRRPSWLRSRFTRPLAASSGALQRLLGRWATRRFWCKSQMLSIAVLRLQRLERLARTIGMHASTGDGQERMRESLANSASALALFIDIILGFALSRLLLHTQLRDLPATLVLHLRQHSVDNLIHACVWLDSWPVGLKLNTELSGFYRDMYTGLIATFDPLVLDSNSLFYNTIDVVANATFALAGASFFIALYTDLIQLATAHVYFMHRIASAQARALLTLLGFLLNLFRGQKNIIMLSHAVRTQRIAVRYELDQLLLGTIGFTLSVFLSPTVLTYASLFWLSNAVRWVIVSLLTAIARTLVGSGTHLHTDTSASASQIHLRLVIVLSQVLYALTMGRLGIRGVPSGIGLRRIEREDPPSSHACLAVTHLGLQQQYKSLGDILFGSDL